MATYCRHPYIQLRARSSVSLRSGGSILQSKAGPFLASGEAEALAVGDGDALEGRFGSQEQIGFRSRSMTAENLLALAPHRFEGIEVWRIRRQKQKPGALGLQGFADSPDFVPG